MEKTASVHQKQPLAKTAISIFAALSLVGILISIIYAPLRREA
jgi:hypothetical protein